MPFKSEKQRKWMHANKPKMAKKWEKEEKSVEEDRDYKAEYKKYGSSKKAKKYRAELNQYNRKKGTYGNGDGKDASHKGGKIAGFEKESTNRGRREKSRLKKESIITEAKYKETYKSITARDKDYKRIWPIGGHPRVKIISWSETEATGRMKTAYIQIEGDKKWVDAYKKIAFNGRGSSSLMFDNSDAAFSLTFLLISFAFSSKSCS